MSPRRRLLRLLFAGGLALALLGPSWFLAKRIRRALRPAPSPPPYGLQLVDSEGRKLGAARGPLQLVLDPFTVYRNAPNQTTDHFTVDALGRRGGAVSAVVSAVAVFVLGGSLVFGQELRRDEEVVTRRLEELLPDRQAWNAGCVGYLSGQELAFYVHRLRDAPAEVVVVVDGWNELFDAWHFAKRRRGENGFNNQFFEIADRLAALQGDKRGRSAIAEDPDAFDRLIADYQRLGRPGGRSRRRLPVGAAAGTRRQTDSHRRRRGDARALGKALPVFVARLFQPL